MKKILISADPYEARAALVEDERVVETYIEREERRSLLGNIYLAKVDAVLPGMEAAFLDAGLDKNAFLHVDEIRIEGLDRRARRSRRIQDLVRSGQTLMVQVVKDPMGTKGARVTMDVSLAGRFLVYVPDGEGGGVSKRLPDGERDRLRDLVKQLEPRLGGGLIVRTAARGAQLEELQRDLALLEAEWEAITARAADAPAPSLLHREADIALALVRDDFRQDVDELIVDDEATYDRIVGYVQEHSPELVPRVRRHHAQTELLRRYGVQEAIESTLRRRVDLPSGGYLLFDYAEAFTIVDVNTGRFVGKGRLEDTIVHNNLEAATEVVRQLRLRDVGGIVVIDFVDMASKTNRDAVIDRLKAELAKDRSKVYLVSISPLGLVELTRQNLTDGVREILTETCPCCQGEGRVLSIETHALDHLRMLRRHAQMSHAEAFLVEAHADVAARMIGAGGGRLGELEQATGKHFSIVATDDVPRERCAIVKEGAAAEILADAIPVAVEQELEVRIAEPHMYQAADAVALLEGGYRVIIGGAGPYLGEEHRVRIDRVGRLEAYATLLDVEPVSEEQMLAMTDTRSDVLEPPRTVGERIDLEERKRKGKRSRTPAKTIETPEEGVSVEFGEDVEPLEPIEPLEPSEEVEESLDGEVDEAEDGGESSGEREPGATGGAPKKRRRRGKRGGKRRTSSTASSDGAAREATEGEGAEVETAPAATADGAAADRPKRKRRRRGGRGRGGGGGSRPEAGDGRSERPSGERTGGDRPKGERPRAPQPAATPAAAPEKPKKGLLKRILGG